jgi:hypothetical protein
MRLSRIGWAAGAVFAVAAGVGVAVWQAPQSIVVPATSLPRAEPAPSQTPRPRPPAEPAPPALAGVPPGVSAEQWVRIEREHAGRPAELRRLIDYLVYADVMQRFRAAAVDQRRPLAQALDAGLDERLARREMTAAEARLVKIAVLDVLMPGDDGGRAAALQRWQAAVQPPATAPDARDGEFQRRQAAVVQAWMARPATQRDPQALERELDSLRRSIFDPP